MRPLPRERPPLASWLIPVVAALLWGGVMRLAADASPATQRSLVFLGGPLLMLAGLHARLFAFLHAPGRMRWLPLPITSARHWQAGARAHGPAVALALVLGLAALVVALPGDATARGIPSNLGLAIELGYFALLAGLLEPFASALAAVLGRRFPEDSRAHELQRSLGGGWTTPEAVVHLYAPAFVLALAVLLAMPGQLSFERWIDGHPLGAGHVAAGLAPVGIAVALRIWSPRLYRLGFWEAVPWLAEATRTLAGPPRPEATPAWARHLPDPWTRLVAVQFWRLTSLPVLRLSCVLAVTGHALLRADPPSGPSVAVAVAAAGVWIAPVTAVLRETRARARLAGALPLPAHARRGAPGLWASLLLTAPVMVLVAAMLGRAIG